MIGRRSRGDPTSPRRQDFARARAALLLALTPVACGYRAENALSQAGPLCVRAASPKVPHAAAVQAALDGAREQLARHDALGSSYPCLVVEVLRVDEAGTGVFAPRPSDAGQPFARGTAVAVVARGWVEQTPGGAASRDTGDVRRSAHAAAVAAGPPDSIQHGGAIQAAAERVGEALAARALGLPEPADEGL